jgi:ABC-2 type transport system permease protein
VASGVLTQVGPLVKRSVLRTFRRPPVVITGILFPLIIFAFTVGGLGKTATNIPGFPSKSYTTFALPLLFVFVGIYAVVVAGGQLGEDVETGFVRRLSTTRLSSSTIMFAQLTGAIVFAVMQATIFLVFGLALGAHVAAGVGGGLLIIALAAMNAVALGGVGMMIALRTRSGQAVQGFFPLSLALLFLSSMNLPRDLITIHWFRDVATFNPYSYLLEAPRSLLVSGWNPQALELGVAVAGSIAVSSIVTTAVSLRALTVAR